MKRGPTLVTLCVLALGLCGTVLASRALDKMHDQIVMREVLYLPTARTVKAISLGYTGLMADVYWTRVVQYFGREHAAETQSYKLLPALLDITTTLDPKLEIAYQFGAFFLSQKPPQGAGLPDEAIALVKKGIAANPEKWRLYYDLGFVYWMEKKDYKSAAATFAEGARVPGAFPWMWTMAGTMAQGGDNLQLARTLWEEVLKQTADPMIQNNARKRLACLDSDEAVIQLQQRADFYAERSGHVPTSFMELIDAGLLRGIPHDPAGNAYQLDAHGRVVVKDLKALPFVTKGLPEGEKSEVFYNKFVVEEKKKQAAQEKSSTEASRPNQQQ